MAYRASGPGVSRDRFHSADPAEIEQFLSARFSDRVDLRLSGGTDDVEYGYETITAGLFVLGHCWTTMAATWDIGQLEDTVFVKHVRHGTMTQTGPVYGEIRTGAGETVILPPADGFRDTAAAFDIDLIALDMVQVARLAEYTYGIAETDVRVTGLSPLTGARQQRWDATVAHVRDEVLGSPVLADSAIALDRAFRRLTGSFLSTFPNTAFHAVVGDHGPRRRIPEPALREVQVFLRAHAGEPVGPMEISAVCGAPAADVAEAMCRRHDVHPAQVLWDARLLGARRALRDADPATADIATIAARWGFTRPSGFRLAYAREFGELPEQTLHS